jgi:hypothetical protein
VQYIIVRIHRCQALSMIKTVTVISSSSCTRSLELQKRSIKSVSLYPRVLKKNLLLIYCLKFHSVKLKNHAASTQLGLNMDPFAKINIK